MDTKKALPSSISDEEDNGKMIISVNGGKLVVENNPDPDYLGFSLSFQSDTGVETPILLVESTASEEYKKTNVYCYEDPEIEEWTRKFSVDHEKMQ